MTASARTRGVSTRICTPSQCRAARGLVDMTQGELAATAGLSISTIVDFEKERGTVTEESIWAIRRSLEAAGVEFTTGDRPGVRLAG